MIFQIHLIACCYLKILRFLDPSLGFSVLAGGRCHPDPLVFGWEGKASPDNLLNGRLKHLIEAAKRGRLDQMLFFGAANDRPAGRPAGQPAEHPAEHPAERPAERLAERPSERPGQDLKITTVH